MLTRRAVLRGVVGFLLALVVLVRVLADLRGRDRGGSAAHHEPLRVAGRDAPAHRGVTDTRRPARLPAGLRAAEPSRSGHPLQFRAPRGALRDGSASAPRRSRGPLSRGLGQPFRGSRARARLPGPVGVRDESGRVERGQLRKGLRQRLGGGLALLPDRRPLRGAVRALVALRPAGGRRLAREDGRAKSGRPEERSGLRQSFSTAGSAPAADSGSPGSGTPSVSRSASRARC